MRLAALSLALVGLLFIGPTYAAAQERPSNGPAVSYLTTATDQTIVTPVARHVYRYGPSWNGYYRYVPYTTYRPRYYWSVPPRYYDYDYRVYPYRSYYYDPSGFRFEYYGPRGRSFGFEF